MKINYVNNKKKITVIAVIGLLLVGVGVGYWHFVINTKPNVGSQTQVPTPPTSEQVKLRQQTESSEKQDYIESKDSPAETASPAPVPTSPDTISLSTKNTATNEVTIFTELAGYSGGVCKLDITNGTKTYSKTVAIIYQPDVSTCAGYTVPYDSLGSGEWHIRLTVTPTGGSPIVKEIVEKK